MSILNDNNISELVFKVLGQLLTHPGGQQGRKHYTFIIGCLIPEPNIMYCLIPLSILQILQNQHLIKRRLALLHAHRAHQFVHLVDIQSLHFIGLLG